jgi:CheY-like chemotaxis protein
MISHASENLDQAIELAAALDEEDLNVWLASRDIAIGSNFAEEISRTISSADFLIVLLSPESLSSPHVKREVNLAITLGKKVLPVLSDETSQLMSNLPYDWNYWLSLAQAVPLTDMKSTAARIAATVHRDLPEVIAEPVIEEVALTDKGAIAGLDPITEPGGVIRVLVVDDHPIFRLGVCDRVKGIGPHVELVGEAADGFKAHDLAASLQPHIILMDLNMPGISGIEATRNIKADFPNIQIIILSASAEIDEINDVLKAGASGFLLKSVTGPELEEAILTVAAGGSVLSPSVTRSLLTDIKTPHITAG